LRRVIHAGWSPWWSLGFFVPAVNYLLIAALCVVPGRPRGIDRPLPRGATGGRAPPALVGLVAGVLLGLVLAGVGVATIERYGLALFFGTPFAMGAIAAFLFNRRVRSTGGETAGLTITMFIAAAGCAFLLGMEGAVCLAMALPFAIVIGLLGAAVGRAIALTGARSLGPATFAVMALPASLTLVPAPATPVEHHVESAVVIDAPPEVVWRHVIAFRPIAEPTELIFRLGVAYPTSARLDGEGVGAVRYCEFSTGAFVEPITAWDPKRRLSFDVVRQPVPLRELSLHDWSGTAASPRLRPRAPRRVPPGAARGRAHAARGEHVVRVGHVAISLLATVCRLHDSPHPRARPGAHPARGRLRACPGADESQAGARRSGALTDRHSVSGVERNQEHVMTASAESQPEWLDRTSYPYASRWLALPDGRMHYVEEGSGPPVVLSHGTPTWSFEYRHVIRALAPQFRCIAPDHLGFGLSDRPANASYTPEAHAERLRAFVNGLGLERFALVAHDFGGPIALPLALDGRVTRLVLLNTWMWPLDDDPMMARRARLVEGALGRFLYKRMNASLRLLMPSAYGDRRKLTPHIYRHYLEPFRDPEARVRVLWALAKSLLGSSEFYYALYSRRNRLSVVPTLIIWGMKDSAFPPPMLERWRSILPHAEVHEIPDAGHWPHEEAPTETAERIREFLSAG
ncbi:MAG TPA: alpha/beta fold hydrolase, partial [Gemmatimonadaceae bacterium]